MVANEGSPAVAVVIPAREAADTIAATVSGARRIAGVDLVVVVDDGSVDSTSAVAQQAGATVVRHKRPLGRSSALATGAKVVAVREAGEGAEHVLLFLDSALGYSAENARVLTETVLSGDAALALANPPGARAAAASAATSRLLRTITGATFTDPLSRVRCTTRAAWEVSLPHGGDALADARWLAHAFSAGHHVAELDCEFATTPSAPRGFLALIGLHLGLLRWRLQHALDSRSRG
ncbi:glycosyltransferase [Micrococcales bacterium 31B]|nr:glycosyltransferase [Micrococcales bacterium 31B]